MKCKNCSKEAGYRHNSEWFCYKHYLIASARQSYKELQASEKDKIAYIDNIDTENTERRFKQNGIIKKK